MSYLLKYNQWRSIYEAANGEIPKDQLASIPAPPDSSQNHKLNPVAAKAYSEMVIAAKADGIVWGITDSYRNLETQKNLVKKKGLYSEGGLAAKPGTSNHGWGSAVDLKVKKGSPEHKWLVNNASRFGFSTIPREPWHWEHKESANLMKTGRMLDSDKVDIPEVSLGGSSQITGSTLSDDEVASAQIGLINAGYSLPVHGIDGKFGPETKKAVEEFQKDNNLPVTGKIDQATYLMLVGDDLPTKPADSDKAIAGASQISKETTDYDTVVATVIDKLEGGYYHPDMRTQNPGKFAAYGRSGETMFGLDRHAGHGLYYSTPRKTKDVLSNIEHIESGEYQYKSQEAKEFWETIDSAGAKNSWQWNYKGGPLENRLRYLAGRIIFPEFNRLVQAYLSPESKKLVMSDGRLLFHFIYATWNGSGWFQKFAKDINDAVAQGITNTDALLKVAMHSRTKEGLTKGSTPNSLIAQGGNKIEKIVGLA